MHPNQVKIEALIRSRYWSTAAAQVISDLVQEPLKKREQPEDAESITCIEQRLEFFPPLDEIIAHHGLLFLAKPCRFLIQSFHRVLEQGFSLPREVPQFLHTN